MRGWKPLRYLNAVADIGQIRFARDQESFAKKHLVVLYFLRKGFRARDTGHTVLNVSDGAPPGRPGRLLQLPTALLWFSVAALVQSHRQQSQIRPPCLAARARAETGSAGTPPLCR